MVAFLVASYTLFAAVTVAVTICGATKVVSVAVTTLLAESAIEAVTVKLLPAVRPPSVLALTTMVPLVLDPRVQVTPPAPEVQLAPAKGVRGIENPIGSRPATIGKLNTEGLLGDDTAKL